MEIKRLKIINGKINYRWGSDNFLQLQGLNLSLLPNNLKSYTDVKLQKDVESLFFPEGYLKIGDIKALLQNVIFKANNQIHADEVLVNSNLGGLDSKIYDVSIKNIYTEPANGNIVIDGLEWGHGDIMVNSILQPETTAKRTSFIFKNVSGKQTRFKLINSGIEGNAFVEDVQISALEKKDIKPMVIKGFKVRGKDLNLSNAALQMNSANFLLADSFQELTGVRLDNINKAGAFNIATPYVRITDQINSFLANDLHLDSILIKSPVINFYKQNISPVTERKISRIPAMKIDHIAIQEPVINVQVLSAFQ